MARIKLDAWLEQARRYAAAASQLAREAGMRVHEAQHLSQQRRLRARVLSEKGRAALARRRRPQDR